jgi:plastocyanin
LNGQKSMQMSHVLRAAFQAGSPLRRRGRKGCAALVLAAALAACGGSTTEEAAAPPAPTVNPVSPETAGNITGAIRLDGTPPPPEPIQMNSDPYCVDNGGAVPPEFAVGGNGALQNVFVYVKDGLGDLTFPVPPTPKVLDQKGCVYTPHVFGIQVGQNLEILNSDSTLHNVHAIPESNREFNRAQALAGITHTHVFSTREVMVPFKCNVHNWMTAYVGVLDHPFYAVTGADGTFRLEGLPPGTYTIEAWHEKLGTQTQSVTIGEKETKDVAFTFKT